MADIRKLTDDLYVAAQIEPADVAELDEYAFRSVLCNRPDNEQQGQPDYADIQRQAEALGMEIEWQPVDGAQISDADVDAFAEHTQNLPRPMLAYCRSGTRCTVLWALSQAGTRDTAEIVQIAAAAGYNLEGLVERINARAAGKQA